VYKEEEMKLTEAMRKRAEQYDGISDMPKLKKLMKKLGAKDNKVRTVSIDFGRAYVYTYDTPSKINYNDYGDSPMAAKQKKAIHYSLCNAFLR